jgi:hypothetical protein
MRPLWVEYPSEVPTFTVDDEFLLGELNVFCMKFSYFFVLFNIFMKFIAGEVSN